MSAGWDDERNKRSSEPNSGEARFARTHFSSLAEVASLQPHLPRKFAAVKNMVFPDRAAACLMGF